MMWKSELSNANGSRSETKFVQFKSYALRYRWLWDITVDGHLLIWAETSFDRIEQVRFSLLHIPCARFKASTLLNVFIGKIKSPTQAQREENSYTRPCPTSRAIFASKFRSFQHLVNESPLKKVVGEESLGKLIEFLSEPRVK